MTNTGKNTDNSAKKSSETVVEKGDATAIDGGQTQRDFQIRQKMAKLWDEWTKETGTQHGYKAYVANSIAKVTSRLKVLNDKEANKDYATLVTLKHKNQPWWKGLADVAFSPIKGAAQFIVGGIGAAIGAAVFTIGAVGQLITAPFALVKGNNKPFLDFAALTGGGLALIGAGTLLAAKGFVEPIVTAITATYNAVNGRSIPDEKYADLSKTMVAKGYKPEIWEWRGLLYSAQDTALHAVREVQKQAKHPSLVASPAVVKQPTVATPATLAPKPVAAKVPTAANVNASAVKPEQFKLDGRVNNTSTTAGKTLQSA